MLNRYTKKWLGAPRPNHYREMRFQCFQELGVPLPPDYKFNDEVIYEISVALSILSGVFNKDHPEHNDYSSLELNDNHYVLWEEIEQKLESLIDNIIELNKPEPLEYD